jgi:translation initiation factor IF-3
LVVTPCKKTQGATINEPRINERIRVPEVRLVGPNGEQVGIVRIEDALRLAQESDLDLVEVAPNSRPPVAKLMDYGKFKYEAAVKAREARRNQANTEIKEMRFRLKIDDHDYETKKGHVVRFLKGGDKVKVTIMFRGREQSRPDMGRRLLMKLAEEVAEFGVVENAPNQEGRNMSLVLGPLKKKAEAKEEQRKAREAQKAAANAEREDRRAPKGAAVEADVPADAVVEDVVEAPVAAPAEAEVVEADAVAEVEAVADVETAAEASVEAPAEPAAKAAPKPKPSVKPTAKAPAKPKPAAKPAAKAPAKAAE